MTRRLSSLGADYFERMFQGDDDPWDLETSAYEQAKYDHSLRVLGDRIHDDGFEVGCARGTLTERLARHCRSLLAIDVSETALAAARERCADQAHVAFERMVFPSAAPRARTFDLIILSEVVYYWNDADIERAAKWIIGHWAVGGDLLLVHWTGDTDYPQSGDEAVAKLSTCLGNILDVGAADKSDRYRLDLWRRRP